MKKIKLKSYQKEALQFALRRKNCALFIDPGMGKTAIILAMIAILKRKHKAARFLVVASLTILENTWPDEIAGWKQFNGLSYTVLHGKDKDQKLQLERDIYFVNPEGLKWLLGTDAKFDVLVIDESSKFKNPSSQRFKLLKKRLPEFDRRVIMSGTPAPNSLQDLFSQYYVVDLGAAFGKYITHFRNKYYNLVNPRFYTYELKRGAKEAIERRMKSRAFVLRNTEIAEPIFNFIKVALDSEMRTVYESMEKKLFATIDAEKVFAASSGSAYRKCHQMANGALYKDDSGEFYALHEQKLEALDELVSELQGKPLLVGYLYRHDLAQIKTRYPKAPHIGGGVPQTERRRILSLWGRGEVPVLLGQLGSISHGLNMQRSGCQDVCYYSLTDDLDAYEQFYRRVYGRHGSKTLVRVHHILARNTVDIAIMRRLRGKSETQVSLLDALLGYRKSKRRA